MIKKLSKPCWIALCDNCGECIFGNDFTSHFESKKELLERIKDEFDFDFIERVKGKIFCSQDCLITFQKKKACEEKT
jgi:hypothetical protein